MKTWLVPVLLLAGCGQPAAPAESDGARLEAAAITAGLVRDPAKASVAGLYARDTDRLCVVARRDDYRIGVTVDYGGGQACSGSGTATRAGEGLDIDLGGDCSFTARLDGETIVFPGQLPAGCDRLCSTRASLSATEVDLQSDSATEAAALRDPTGRALCS